MKVEIDGFDFRYISDNTNELDNQTAFLKTKQNEIYADKAEDAHSIVGV